MMTRLTPDLWVAQSEIYATNSTVWLRDGLACLVDPAVLAAEIEAIGAWVAAQAARPHFLVLTHSHWDHYLGVRHFPGVPVVAHAGYWPEQDRHSPAALSFVARNRLIPEDGSFALPRPEILVEDELSLLLDDLAVRLIPTPGHAPDHLSVYEPETGALCAGDILSDVEMPSIMHSLAAYEKTIAALSACAVHVLVPGHGQPTAGAAQIERIFARERDYLAGLRAGIEEALRRGLAMEEAVAHCAGLAEPFPGFEDTHKLNVESVYVELGGPGDPDDVGYGRNWKQMLAGPQQSAAQEENN